MTDIAGKYVLVTGAASGIGRASAQAFASERATALAVCDIDRAGLDRTLDDLNRLGCRAIALFMDVSDRRSVENAVAGAIAEFGRIDLVMNAAGIGMLGPFEELTDEDWHRIMDINLWGTINVARAIYPHMLERGSGHMVTVSSANGIYVPMPFIAPYATTKFGVAGLSEALLVEGRPHGIRVTCVCPGNVKTPIYDRSLFRGFSEKARVMTRINMLVAEKPDRTAVQIVKGIKKNRFLVVTTPVARLSALARRHLPTLWFAYTYAFTRVIERVMDRYREG
jgi:NAD(P)-dependent dehydrogenase (short-subunit alcohol dehydrogenase family)